MPKHEILHTAGHPATKELRELLSQYFGEKDIQKLEKFGGRVVISLTAPYNPKRKGKKPKLEVGERLITSLYEYRDRPDELKEQLGLLSVKQLRELGRRIDHPLRTKSSRQEIIEELVAYFYSEEVWKRISHISGGG